MKQMKYKVEAFIVPVGNDYNVASETVNIQLNNIQNIDIEKREIDRIENNKNDSLSLNENLQNLENCSTIENTVKTDDDINKLNEGAAHRTLKLTPIKEKGESCKDKCIDLCYHECRNYSAKSIDGINKSDKDTSLDVSQIKYELFTDNKKNSFSSASHRTLKLTPIKERGEDCEDKCMDLCYHGCKNGCSTTVPTPQEVSEKVFKENWLQKLQDIKRRELKLKYKEITLQNHEKILLKKEKEIKILEKTLRDKLKQINLYFKENKNFDLFKVDTLESQKDILESLVDSKEKLYINDNPNRKLNNVEINKLNVYTENIQPINPPHNQTEQLNKHKEDAQNFMHTEYKNLYQEETCSGSSSSSIDNQSAGKKIKQQSNIRSSTISRASYFKSNYDSNKVRKPCKMYYDDLDSTLSADIGDSSFVQTCQKFNPELYKRPFAFKRSASERHVKYTNHEGNANLENEAFQTSIEREQEKVFKRVTRNISVLQDKDTKFQHYGLIDQNIENVTGIYKVENEKRYSYLNLETSSKICSQEINKDLKTRPISWNEQTNECFQKKQKAHNMTIKKVHVGNKENVELHSKSNDKLEKIVKKRDTKNRIFTIFR